MHGKAITLNSLPKVTLIAAISLDGVISRSTVEAVTWSSDEDQKWFLEVLPMFDVSIVGKTTFDLLTKPVSKRNRVILTRSVASSKQVDDHTWHVNLKGVDLQSFLKEKQWTNVALLGGCQTYTTFIRDYWIDELWITVEPVVFGSGIRLFSDPFDTVDFTLISSTQLNREGSLLLKYKNNK